MQYGIPYKGSKSKIAEWVVRNLPASHTLVDLFAGGCAVTHCALLSGKYERVIANDLNGTPELFRECVMGEMDGYSNVSSRSEFSDARTTDPAIAVLYSFGNGLTSYLWSQEIEPAKTAAARMLSAPSLHERRINYRKFIKAVSEYLSDKDAQTALVGGGGHGLQDLESLERLQSLERLERLESLERLERLERLECTRADYRLIQVPDGATVYADIPYKQSGKNQYGATFDYESFEQWLAEVPFPVYVSEYTAPNGCVEVQRKEHATNFSASKKGKKTVERLFVQKRFAYKEQQ